MQGAEAMTCVGRDSELARLRDLYEAARVEGERLALLEGPSGVGKAQILHTFRSRVRLDGGVVLEGRCEPGRAFGPFAELIASALRFLREVGGEARVRMDGGDLACSRGCHRFWHEHRGDGDALIEPNCERLRASELGPGATEVVERRLRFYDAIRTVLQDVARVRAPVVVLHGLERADLGTLQLLQNLLEGTGPWTQGVAPERQLRALFLASVRTDVEPTHRKTLASLRDHPSTITVEVGRLDPDGVRAYLQSPETVARVIERTGGLPEAIDLLLDGDPLTPLGRVERRLVALSAPARTLVDALAVLEHPTDAETLARVGQVALSAAVVTELGASDLVRQTIVDGKVVFAFARPTDLEHTYQILGDATEALHRRALDHYAQHPGAEQEAARHALAARDIDRAIPLALAAARAHAARHAHAEAAAFLERVAAHTVDGPPPEVREYLADLYRLAGDYKQALVHAHAVRQRAPTSAHATRRVGQLLTLAGHLDEAAATLVDARHLGETDSATVAEVDAELGELHYQRSCYDQAAHHAQLAIEGAEQHHDVVVELCGRNTLAKIALARKQDGAARLFEENRDLAVSAGLPHQEAQAWTNLGVALLRSHDLNGAEQAFRAAVRVATSAGDTRELAIATENLAVLAHLRHDYDRAQSLYHEAVALLKRLGNRPMLARVATNLGELYMSLGQPLRARTLCDFATHMGGTGLPPSVAAEILVLRGRVEAESRNLSAAQVSLEAALRIYERLGEARASVALLELARLALVEGDVPHARSLLDAIPHQESPKHAAEVAIVTASLERAAGHPTLAPARRAVDLAERAEDREVLLRALLCVGRALCDEGSVAAAHSSLERAEAIEAELTERTPVEARTSWADRPLRAQLSALQAHVAHAAAEDGQRITLRPSTVPPPRPTNITPEQRARWTEAYPRIVGNSPPVGRVLSMLDKIAPTDALVLVRGESGTGKELVAEALHNNSRRRGKPLVKVNCAALVETLLLSELFGHERGAFTGASARKKGRFEMAEGGTLFLDEIGDISAKTQVALLRVLQERQFERVGGTQPIRVDVRIIAATNRNLEEMVQQGTFREDLYYRLRGVMIDMPPLRSHLDDLPTLCAQLLDRVAEERGEAPKMISHAALALLGAHQWPGNVRELENVLRSATLFADSYILEPHDFAAFAALFSASLPTNDTPSLLPPATPPPPVEDQLYDRIRSGEESLLEIKKVIERECIMRALREADGNITQAATLLGMKRPRLSQLVKQYGLNTSNTEARS